MDYQETQRYIRKVYNSYTNIALIQVFRSDVDFFVKRSPSEGELNDKFYPPRFEGYFASFRENATLNGGKIAFKGATSGIVYDIHLDCSTANQGKLSCSYSFYNSGYFTEAVDMSAQTKSQPEPLGM